MNLSAAPQSRFCCRNPRKVLPQILLTLATSLAYVCGGAARGWTSPVIPALLSRQDFQFDTNDAAWLASLMSIAGWLGLGVIYPLQRFGRRLTLLGLGVPMVAGFLLLGLANDKYTLYAGRIIVGGSLASSITAAQIYISECASPNIRGSLGSITSFAMNLGVVIAFALGSVVEWDQLGLILVAFPLLFMSAMLFTPESPMWLITKGRHAEASKALQRLRGPFTLIDSELKKMQDKIAADEAIRSENQQSQWRELLKRPVWHPLVLTLCIFAYLPLGGEAVITTYAVYIFKEASIGWDARQAAIIVSVAQLLGVLISGSLVDRAGRRVLLMISGTGMAITEFILATYFYFQENGMIDENSNLGWLPVATITAFSLSQSIGFANIPYMLMGEIFPTHLRSFLCSCCISFFVLVMFVVLHTYPLMSSSIGQSGAFYFYGSCAASSVLFVYVCLPETKGKTLAEIEEIFAPRPEPAHMKRNLASTDPGFSLHNPGKEGMANQAFEDERL